MWLLRWEGLLKLMSIRSTHRQENSLRNPRLSAPDQTTPTDSSRSRLTGSMFPSTGLLIKRETTQEWSCWRNKSRKWLTMLSLTLTLLSAMSYLVKWMRKSKKELRHSRSLIQSTCNQFQDPQFIISLSHAWLATLVQWAQEIKANSRKSVWIN